MEETIVDLEHIEENNVSVKSNAMRICFLFFMPLGLFIALYYFVFSEKRQIKYLVCVLITIFTAGRF